MSAGTMGRSSVRGWLCACAALLLTACNAEPVVSQGSGTDVTPGACGRGLAVALSDYFSTNVALVGYQGEVWSGSLISSGSAGSALTAALTGDVVFPSSPMLGESVVLIDRYPNAVLSFVDVKSAAVRGQLDVRTGFSANPHDYLEVEGDKAYVTRFGSDPRPGSEAFDGGNDILIVDPVALSIRGRIDLAPALPPGPFLARPERLVGSAGRAYVVLGAYSADYLDSADGRVVEIDTTSDSISRVITLPGLHGCSSAALSPDQDLLAVACAGRYDGRSNPSIAHSGVALIDVRGVPQETKRFAAADLGSGPVGIGLAFASQRELLVTSFGRTGIGGEVSLDDALLLVELTSGRATELLRSAGTPFSLGEVSCAADCDVCVLADASRDGGVLQYYRASSMDHDRPRPLRVETRIGLPPRYLGRF